MIYTRTDKEDIAQVAKIAIWQAKQRLLKGYSPLQEKTYIKKFVLWEIQKYAKKQPVFEPLEQEIPYEQDFSSISFECLLQSLEDDRAKSLLSAIYQHGYTVSEWSKTNNVNQSTASKIHQRALQKLKRTLSAG